MGDPNDKYTWTKPHIQWRRSMRGWKCSMFWSQYNCTVVGYGKTPELAYKAYRRRLQWKQEHQRVQYRRPERS